MAARAANGLYDLQFALFDSASSGAQIGSSQTLNSVLVSAGVFKRDVGFRREQFQWRESILRDQRAVEWRRILHFAHPATASDRDALCDSQRERFGSGCAIECLRGLRAGWANQFRCRQQDNRHSCICN